MTVPSFGYQTSRPADDIVSALGADFSKIGVCTTSSDADPQKFPLNKAVRFTSTDAAMLAGAGTGALAAALTGYNDQLGGQGADVIAVRVAEGTDADPAQKLAHTLANIVGDAGSRSGLWALRNAAASVKAVPRLIDVPGGYTIPEINPGADNPVRAALAVHLEAMKAITVCEVDPTDKIKAIASRELMSSDRMMPLGVAAMVYETVNGASTLVQRSMTSRILGLIAATDNNYPSGKPFDSFANKAILGISDINRPIGFDLGDGSTEGQLMLAQDIAIVVEGSSADVGAIADGGFTFIGVESAATSDLWSQIHQVRGADYIDVEIAQITREYLGGRITPRRAEAWLNAIKFMLLDHVNAEDILGFSLKFPAVINSIADVRNGQLEIQTGVEPAPVFRRAVNQVRRYRPAVEALIAAIVANAGESTGVVS